MKSAAVHPFNSICLSTLLLWATIVPSCESKSNPVIPTTGHGGLVASASIDSGALEGGLGTSDAGGLALSDAQTDAADSAAPNGPCDLLTYVRTQKGCVLGQACYPVSGSGKCQNAGAQGAFNPCVPDDPTGTQTCAAGLACAPTRDMGTVCLTLCEVGQPCDLGYVCAPVGTTGAGMCQL
jgi:hypothetical protein